MTDFTNAPSGAETGQRSFGNPIRHAGLVNSVLEDGGGGHVVDEAQEYIAAHELPASDGGAAGHYMPDIQSACASGNLSPETGALGHGRLVAHFISAQSINPASAGAGGHANGEVQYFSASGNLSASADASGHSPSETHVRVAACETFSLRRGRKAKSQPLPDDAMLSPQSGLAGGDLGHAPHVPHLLAAEVANLIAEIQALWRRRVQWHRAEKSLTLQASAICRGFAGGDKRAAGKMLARIEDGETAPEDIMAEIAVTPLLAARATLHYERGAVEKALAKMVRGLPVHAWAKEVYGLGPLGLASIVGEAGDIGSYKSVSAVWKRFGLAVIGGERQRKKANLEEAALHGYAPHRRSIMWNVGGGLIGGMGKGPRPLVGEDISAREDWSTYQRLFVERLRYEAERDPAAHRKEPVASPKTGEMRESFSAHAANRAKRYVEKRFLRELFSAWRAATSHTQPMHPTPPSEITDAA